MSSTVYEDAAHDVLSHYARMVIEQHHQDIKDSLPAGDPRLEIFHQQYLPKPQVAFTAPLGTRGGDRDSGKGCSDGGGIRGMDGGSGILDGIDQVGGGNDDGNGGDTSSNTNAADSFGTVGIIGAGTWNALVLVCVSKIFRIGTGGLYTTMMLDSLGIKFTILESSDRVGGRLYTHQFNSDPYQYYVSPSSFL